MAKDAETSEWETAYDALSPEEKEKSSFVDFLGGNAQTICQGCSKIVEYDEVDEDGYCFDCQEEESE